MYRIESAAPGSSRLHDAAFCQSWNNFTIIGANAGNETLPFITPPLNPTNNKALWNNPQHVLLHCRDFSGEEKVCRVHQLVPEFGRKPCAEKPLIRANVQTVCRKCAAAFLHKERTPNLTI
ncbi:MAG: hypothetical protein SOV54_02230 [Faecalibacterium prausnitzii]|nr:hypothetical protein [Faecalibacterium prausnitzii]